MSNPHSLPFSSSPQQPEHAKRNSLTQLPLPHSLNAAAPQRPPGGNLSIRTQGTSIHVPGSPTVANIPQSPSSRGDTNYSHSPTTTNFQRAPPIHVSTTHAGGIQPSASFFRPSRPIQQQQYSRPVSISSAHAPPQDADIFPMSTMSKRHSGSSEGPSYSIGGGPESVADDHTQYASLRNMKQSREPLLPIGERPNTLLPRPSVMRERSGGSNTSGGPLSPARNATGRLMRNSLERVFQLGRGLSFDSSRKSTSNAPSRGMPSEVHLNHPGDGKLHHDEEHGAPASPISRYKNSSSPVQFAGDLPLNLSATRHNAMHPTPSSSPSPDHSFMPSPPDTAVPLSAVPILDSKGRPMRKYQLHKSRNIFFFGGRVLAGGDSPWAFIASFALVLGVSGVWFGTTCVWWWHNESPAVAIIGGYLVLIIISSMLYTVRLYGRL